jgi:hypothetical protein
MTQSTRERNKTLVLQAFDLLFNKRYFAAAEKYWSPHLPTIRPTTKFFPGDHTGITARPVARQ